MSHGRQGAHGRLLVVLPAMWGNLRLVVLPSCSSSSLGNIFCGALVPELFVFQQLLATARRLDSISPTTRGP
jgi:hypothetical protein